MEHGHESPLQIDVNQDAVVVTVIVAGQVDSTTATALSRRLLTIGAARPERLVLDLSGLVFVDVAGARTLDATYTLLQAECPVILRQPRPAVRKVFELTGLMEGSAVFGNPYAMSDPGEDARAVRARVNHEDRERVD